MYAVANINIADVSVNFKNQIQQNCFSMSDNSKFYTDGTISLISEKKSFLGIHSTETVAHHMIFDNVFVYI